MQIYLLISDQSQGPFTPEQITEKIKVGECTADTLAWKEGMDEWQAWKHVCPLPKEPHAFPDTRSALPVGQQRLASGSKVFFDFFRGYKGLLQRIQRSPLPQPAQWYDRYLNIFPAAFVAFAFGGLGLIPLFLTSRLSRADKGRLTVIAAWPIWIALLPFFGFLLLFLLFLLPIAALVMMWRRKWFTPKIRYSVTSISGLLLAWIVISAALEARETHRASEERKQEAQKEFREQRANVFAAIRTATDNAQTLNLPRYDEGEALIERYKFIQDKELSNALADLSSAIYGSGQRYFRTHAKQVVSLSDDERRQGLRVTQSGYLAASSEEVLDQAMSYQNVGDTAALSSLIESGLLIRLKGGVRVQLMDTHLFSGLVEIRPIGTTANLWTNFEAIAP